MKPITLDEYKEAWRRIFPKYFYVAKELGEGAKAEEILKVMESLAGVVMKKRVEDKLAPFGFNKEKKDAESQSNCLKICRSWTTCTKNFCGILMMSYNLLMTVRRLSSIISL